MLPRIYLSSNPVMPAFAPGTAPAPANASLSPSLLGVSPTAHSRTAVFVQRAKKATNNVMTELLVRLYGLHEFEFLK